MGLLRDYEPSNGPSFQALLHATHCLPCLLADRDEMMPLNYQRSVPILTAALTLSWGREIKKHNV